jgi:hypothetical protein
MRTRRIIAIILILLAVLAVAVRRFHFFENGLPAFDRSPHNLIYTHHALCRMDCRQITKEDILKVLEEGEIISNKSNPNGKPCPTFALQDNITNDETIRVIFAQCSGETKVVTCYDIHRNPECHCPGDEKSNKNN